MKSPDSLLSWGLSSQRNRVQSTKLQYHVQLRNYLQECAAFGTDVEFLVHHGYCSCNVLIEEASQQDEGKIFNFDLLRFTRNTNMTESR